jgi:hypothetical protein
MAAEGVIFAIQQRERVLCVYLAIYSLCENHCLSELRLPGNLRAPPLLHVALLVLVVVFRQCLSCSAAPTAPSLWAFRISQPGPSADVPPRKVCGSPQDDDKTIYFHSATFNRLLGARVTSRFSASRLLAFCGGGAHMEGILARLDTPQGDHRRGF